MRQFSSAFNRPLALLTAIALTLSVMFMGLNFISPALAAANDYTVSGGNPVALPTVGDPSVSLPTLTITDAGGDDFTFDPETLIIAIDSVAYPAVVFDQDVINTDLTIAGDCGYTAANALNYTDAYTVEVPVINGTVCGAGEIITVAGLMIETIYSQTAPGATALVSVDNDSTSGGTPVDTSDTVNLSVTAADANVSIDLGTNSVVAATGDTTITLTTPFTLDIGDTVVITFPASFDVTNTDFDATGTFQGTGDLTCADDNVDTVTCTVISDLTNTTGTLIIAGIETRYAEALPAAVLEVKNEGNATENIAIDNTITTEAITPADANANVVLASPTVGAAGNTVVTLTLPRDLASGDVVDINFPASVNVSALTGAAAVDDFGGGGSFACDDSVQTVTCTSNGVITAGTGTITITGITGSYAGTTDVTSVQVEDQANATDDIAADLTVTTTDTVAADAAASVVLASPAIGGVGNTTVTLTIPRDLVAGDAVDITFPAHIDVTGATYSDDTFAEDPTFSGCSDSGQVVTCIVDAAGLTAEVNGTIVMTGITALASGTTDITSVEVEDQAVAANDIATDTTVALTDSPASSLTNTSLSLSNNQASASTSVTVAMKLVHDLADDGKIKVTMPAGFVVTGATSATSTTVDGTFTVSGVGSVITVERNGDGTLVAGGTDISLTFSSVTNPADAGGTSPFTFQVTDASDLVLDENTNVTGVQIAAVPGTTTTTTTSGGGGGGGGYATNDPCVGLTAKQCQALTGTVTTSTNTGTPSSASGESTPEPTFTDISGHWAEDYIMELVSLGVVSGYTNEDGTERHLFGPNDVVTRAQFAKMATLAFQTPLVPVVGDPVFGDVANTHWSAKYILAAYTAGIIKGFEDGNYHPEESIGRDAALKITLEAAGLGESVPRVIFDDVPLTAWAVGYVTHAFDLMIVSGKTSSIFDLAGGITRAEASKIIVETLRVLSEQQ